MEFFFSSNNACLEFLLGSSQSRLYTDVVLFFFSFFSKTSASLRAKRACENERGARALRWRSINPLQFIFYHARSTDFKEKIEGL